MSEALQFRFQNLYFTWWGVDPVSHTVTRAKGHHVVVLPYSPSIFTVIISTPLASTTNSNHGAQTSRPPTPASGGVLERPRPLGLKQPGGVVSAGYLDHRNDHLVSSMG